MLPSNVRNEGGSKLLRDRFDASASVVGARPPGPKNNLFGKVYSAKSSFASISPLATKPQRILSKEQRHDPFAEPPPITDHDLSQGMINLVNRGMIPKDVDLTPAFSRGLPAFAGKPARLYEKAQQFVKQEVQTGPTLTTAVKLELVPVPVLSTCIVPRPQRN